MAALTRAAIVWRTVEDETGRLGSSVGEADYANAVIDETMVEQHSKPLLEPWNLDTGTRGWREGQLSFMPGPDPRSLSPGSSSSAAGSPSTSLGRTDYAVPAIALCRKRSRPSGSDTEEEDAGPGMPPGKRTRSSQEDLRSIMPLPKREAPRTSGAPNADLDADALLPALSHLSLSRKKRRSRRGKPRKKVRRRSNASAASPRARKSRRRAGSDQGLGSLLVPGREDQLLRRSARLQGRPPHMPPKVLFKKRIQEQTRDFMDFSHQLEVRFSQLGISTSKDWTHKATART
ncbi:MAG: hypothetical protein M1815_000279 [Lichina confinis]|nr:MAG: hypothetical protein M1815_000279 [Lichina confinis]